MNNKGRRILFAYLPGKNCQFLVTPWKYNSKALEKFSTIPLGKVRPPLCMDIKWNSPLLRINTKGIKQTKNKRVLLISWYYID